MSSKFIFIEAKEYRYLINVDQISLVQKSNNPERTIIHMGVGEHAIKWEVGMNFADFKDAVEMLKVKGANPGGSISLFKELYEN